MKVSHKNSYTHIETGSDTVCFMLSGVGYTYEKPLLYYSTMALLERGIDVVQIHYSYEADLLQRPFADIVQTMLQDIEPVLAAVPHTKAIFIAKSLGTIPLAAALLKREAYQESSMIFLTPLLKFPEVYEALLHSTQQGLVVIGTEDPHYDAGKLEQLGQTGLRIQAVPGANHSLDVGFDVGGSLHVMSAVMQSIRDSL
ncbi:alpha/beta hydrolase [Ectobacillus ponti]|uniref:Alpha/beta hydrolase n=1 Tax=Ectobacillus ponti TaxID=2961894 RepID=A0AA41X6M3_9BACI|nr:alpha/beta hydrolase [Ectobacillus ponti]MCP8967790.1 alpha/beta hydrolase [Ectobacillus ponti]